MDERVVGIGLAGIARVQAVRLDDVVREVALRHGLSGRAAGLAAELTIANALMAAYVKGEERVQLQLQAEDPTVSFLGEVGADGHCRARLTPDRLPGAGPRIDGILLAIKSDVDREMYRGVTEVRGETVERALQRHLATSDQVAARVRIVTDDRLSLAVGIVMERLPGPAGMDLLTDQDFQDLTEGLVDEDGPSLAAALASRSLLGAPLEVLDTQPLVFRCACSLERVERMVASLGTAEIVDMIASDHGAEVTCHFCREVYRLDEDALMALVSAGDPT